MLDLLEVALQNFSSLPVCLQNGDTSVSSMFILEKEMVAVTESPLRPQFQIC